MRLDKFLCETLNLSRKEAKDFVKKSSITINDVLIKDSSFVFNENTSRVLVNDKPLTHEKYVYFMLNKPADYITATKDDNQKTVLDLFKSENRNDLFAVGRLDKDTVGLLIITNDGDLSHHLTSPKHHVSKTYYVKTRTVVSDEDLKILSNGVELTGDGMTKPAKTERISDCELYLTITEGMYHQVKRMLNAVNNEVIFLKRVSMGDVSLDEGLKEGQYRRLTTEEIELLKK